MLISWGSGKHSALHWEKKALKQSGFNDLRCIWASYMYFTWLHIHILWWRKQHNSWNIRTCWEFVSRWIQVIFGRCRVRSCCLFLHRVYLPAACCGLRHPTVPKTITAMWKHQSWGAGSLLEGGLMAAFGTVVESGGTYWKWRMCFGCQTGIVIVEGYSTVLDNC